MNRRNFLRQSGWLAAGTCALPAWLQACKKSDWNTDNDFSGEVIIIGAGLAGLYAAEMLIKQGISVKVLEATDRWGGRMRSLPLTSEAASLAQNRVIQGQFSVLYDVLQQTQTPLTPYTENNLYYFNGALNTEAEANQNTFFQEMLQAVESLNTFNGADITVQEYFDALGISTNLAAVSNVLTAQPLGTSYDRISALGIAKQYELWSADIAKYVVSNSNLEQAFEQVFANALNSVQYATPVATIEYSGSRIILTDTLGANHECDRVLLTIPLHALQNGSIAFSPALNITKLDSINRIGIDMSYCALFKLSTPLWIAGTRRIIGSDIVQSFEVNDEGWVYAEVSGAQAAQVASIFGDPLTIIQNQFNQLFPGAIDQITEAELHHWAGNRSYDPTGVGNARSVLAQPINSKLYFAGEATHTGGHHGTMHGAMESALRAVTEILRTTA
jgi:monoamine oxidase